MSSDTQTIHPTQLPPSLLSHHSYTVMQFKSTQNDDDDDICPVCESDCTCGNTNQSSTSQHPPIPKPAPLPLKIRLPPLRRPSPLPNSLSSKHTRNKSTKPKQTTAGSAIVDGAKYNHHTLRQPGLLVIPDHHLDPSPVTESDFLRGGSPLTPEPELESPTKPRGKPKQHAKNATPKAKNNTLKLSSKAQPTSKKLSTKKNTVAGIRRKKNKSLNWTATSSGRANFPPASRHRVQEVEDFYVNRIPVDSETESVHFPTAVSAITTSSGNEDDSASVSSDSFHSDCSLKAEEENLILVEEQARLRREILNHEESWHMEKRKWDHLIKTNNWEIRPRKKSVGAGETESEGETESDSEVQEEEEDEGDDDDPDIRYGRGLVTGWQSSDDDFDAELFFGTLTDSSAPGSDADAEDGEESADDQSDDNSDLSTMSLTEATVAGLFSSSYDDCSLVVTEDWDGRLVFANGLKDGQGVPDVHFEANAVQRQSSMGDTMDVILGDQNALEDTDQEEDIITDDGETTDDMLDHQPAISTPQGIVPLPFRCPTPPVTSIDPLSTFSPNSISKRSKLPNVAVIAPSPPKPSDILAGSKKSFREKGDVPEYNEERSASVSTASPPETAASSTQSRLPLMGSFKNTCADPKRCAIIDGSKKAIFSPFSRSRRAKKNPFDRGKKRTATGNDTVPYPSKRVRQSSLPDSSRPLLVDAESPVVQSSPELTITAPPIDIDDVLDSSFLDSDGMNEAAVNTSTERHYRNLTRWERVPMGTFRRSRTAHMSENNFRVNSLVPPNDGVSYGSLGGHVLRRSLIGAALWQTDSNKPSKLTPGTVPVSPVIFPQRGREYTPTNQIPDFLQKSDAGPSKSRKQKRKEKKRKRAALASNITTELGYYHDAVMVSQFDL